MKMKLKHLETCQLPDRVELDGKVITRPETWNMNFSKNNLKKIKYDNF